MEFIGAALITAGVIWLFVSKTGQTFLGMAVLLGLIILFPPTLFVLLVLYWMRADANRPAAPDYELMYVRRFYPNSYRQPMSGRIILMS